MANNAGNVVVGKPALAGGVLVAPVGSTLPTDEAAALDAAFVASGYATDDGVSRTEDRNNDTVTGWGGDTIAAIQKSLGVTFKFSFAEYLNALTQKSIYGDANVTATAATTSSGAKLAIQVTSAPAPHKAWVFEIVSGVKKVRIVLPDAQVTDTDDVSYKDDEIAARGVTLTCFPDSSGVYVYEYTNDGVKAVA